MYHDFRAIGDAFGLHGEWVSASPYGSGHINDTYAVIYNQAGTNVRYIFQRINDRIFRNIPNLMDNILRVTKHQRERIHAEKLPDPSRRSLTVIPTRKGSPFHHDSDGYFWRAYYFIEKARTYDRIETLDQARAAAAAFACFQMELVDLPGERLHETIPDFHNTRRRYEHLETAIAADVMNRAAEAVEEIEFFRRCESDLDAILSAMSDGSVPERVTHNDTKLNNVMIDDRSGEGICVIDLDTVMPGSVLYDFGDMIRTATNSAPEDARDPGKVEMRMEMFEAIADAYLEEASAFLTPMERELLPMSGRIITLEIGIRFLTDFLSGDQYFKVHRNGHNLDRCRTQIQLARSIESNLVAMERYVQNKMPSCVI